MHYSLSMHTALTILLVLAMAVVAAMLVVGIVVFTKGGETNRRWSVKLMSLRVAAQAFVLVVLALLLLQQLGGMHP